MKQVVWLGKLLIKLVGLCGLSVWCVKLCGWAPVVLAAGILSVLAGVSVVSALRTRHTRDTAPDGVRNRLRRGVGLSVLAWGTVVTTVWFACGFYSVGEFQQVAVRELDGTLITVETRRGTWWHPAGVTTVSEGQRPHTVSPSTQVLLQAARQWGTQSAALTPVSGGVSALMLETDADVHMLAAQLAAVYQADAGYGLVYKAWVPNARFSAYTGADAQTLAGQYEYSTDTLTINLKYRKGGSWAGKDVVRTVAHEVWHAQGEWVVKLEEVEAVTPEVLSRHLKFLDEAVCQIASAEAAAQWMRSLNPTGAEAKASIYNFLWEICLGTAGFNVVYGEDSSFYEFVSEEHVSESWVATACRGINWVVQEIRTARLQQEWVETCSQLGVAEIDADTWGKEADTNRITVLIQYYVSTTQRLMLSRGGCLSVLSGDTVCTPNVCNTWWQGLYEAGLPCG